MGEHWQMVRQKGDKKVQTWTHSRSGLSADIFLRGTSFRALFLEKMFDAPDVSILRKQLSDYAEHWIKMEWHPIIEIEMGEPSNYRSEIQREGIEFGCKRYYLSVSPAGEVFEVGWDVAVSHRKAKMNSLGGSSYSRRGRGFNAEIRLAGLPLGAPMKNGDNWMMDHDETLWAAFQQITEGIYALRKKLKQLVGTNEGIKQLKDGANARQLLLKQ